jgi:hypothetical protein
VCRSAATASQIVGTKTKRAGCQDVGKKEKKEKEEELV